MLGHYEVIPRYSAGSPAALDEDTALRVARQEREGYEATLEGCYGQEAITEAHRLGLHGIVLENRSKGNKLVYFDVLTETEYRDVPYSCFRHPDAVIVVVKGFTARYYYRRELIFTGKSAAERLGTDSLLVLKALGEKVPGFDPFSKEAFDLWNSRRSA